MKRWIVSPLIKKDAIEKRLNAVNYMQPPYSTAYPEFVDYWKNEEHKIPLNNKINTNIFYKIDKLIDGDKKWMDWENNLVTKTAPDFWNDDNKEFILQSGKIKTNELNGFEAINFNKIGYKK